APAFYNEKQSTSLHHFYGQETNMNRQSNPQEGRNHTMVLNLSSEEWRRLLTLIDMGEWVAGAHKEDSENRFDAVASRIFKEASGWGLKGFVQQNEEDGQWRLSN